MWSEAWKNVVEGEHSIVSKQTIPCLPPTRKHSRTATCSCLTTRQKVKWWLSLSEVPSFDGTTNRSYHCDAVYTLSAASTIAFVTSSTLLKNGL